MIDQKDHEFSVGITSLLEDFIRFLFMITQFELNLNKLHIKTIVFSTSSCAIARSIERDSRAI